MFVLYFVFVWGLAEAATNAIGLHLTLAIGAFLVAICYDENRKLTKKQKDEDLKLALDVERQLTEWESVQVPTNDSMKKYRANRQGFELLKTDFQKAANGIAESNDIVLHVACPGHALAVREVKYIEDDILLFSEFQDGFQSRPLMVSDGAEFSAIVEISEKAGTGQVTRFINNARAGA